MTYKYYSIINRQGLNFIKKNQNNPLGTYIISLLKVFFSFTHRMKYSYHYYCYFNKICKYRDISDKLDWNFLKKYQKNFLCICNILNLKFSIKHKSRILNNYLLNLNYHMFYKLRGIWNIQDWCQLDKYHNKSFSKYIDLTRLF